MTVSPTLLQQRPVRRPEVVLGPGLLRGTAPVHQVKDQRTGSRYELGAKEHFVLARLDGTRSLEEIGDAYAGHFGRRLGEASWLQLLGLLGSRDLLVTDRDTRTDRDTHADRETGAARPYAAPAPERIRTVGLLRGDVVLYHPSALIHTVRRRMRPLLHPGVLVPLLLLAAAAQGVLLAHLPELGHESWALYRQPALIPLVFCLLWVGMLLHELAHGLSAVHFGGDATEIGLSWQVPVLRLYCTVEDVLLFRSRRHRAATAAAGLVADLVLQIPLVALWLLLPTGDATRTAVGALLLLGSARIVFNLLPVPPLDGYLMLGHALNLSRPATESRRYLRLLLRRDPAARGYPRRLAATYLGYAATIALGTLAVLGGVVWLVLRRVPAPYGWPTLGGLALLTAARVAFLWWRSKHPPRGAKPVGPPGADPATAPAPDADADADDPAPAVGRPLHQDRPHQPEEARMRPVQSSARPAVVAENVSKAYGRVRACHEVSLTVERGEMFGVLGPNGAGKTTLIEIMEGLRRPDSGRVTVLGSAPWPRDREQLLKVGIQTQASAFFIRLTAREHLETVAALYGLDRKAAHDAIDRFGLGASADTRVEKLSGGQRQRLALAAALCHDPDLLFLDEPTAALDPQARRDLWQLMRDIRDQGKTIVYTTHHLDEAEALCDRVAIMSGGSVVAVGDPQELIGSLEEPVRVLVPGERITVGAARALAGADSAVSEGTSVVIATRTPGIVLSAVAEIAGIQGIRTRTASLEDVYLKLTGTEYQP